MFREIGTKVYREKVQRESLTLANAHSPAHITAPKKPCIISSAFYTPQIQGSFSGIMGQSMPQNTRLRVPATTPPDIHTVLGIKEIARLYSVSRRTVLRWLRQGLPYRQVGPRCRILIQPNDVDAFLPRRCVTSSNLDQLVDETVSELTRTGVPQKCTTQ